MQQVCEMPIQHGLMGKAEAEKNAVELFRSLGLPNPDTFGNRYPHEVSGGQLQRAMTAMAISCRPDILTSVFCSTVFSLRYRRIRVSAVCPF